MKRYYHFIVIALMGFIACDKQDDCQFSEPITVATTEERNTIRSYLNANSLPYTEHSSGVFYNVDTTGSGATPNVCSTVLAGYRGTIMTTGFVFDSTATGASAAFKLGDVIAGWQYGLRLVQKSATITMYIPPSLGYGNRTITNSSGAVVIPANSYLRFRVKLNDVN